MEALQKQAESEDALLKGIAKQLEELASDIELRVRNISSIQEQIKKITTAIEELKSEMNHEENMKLIKQTTNQ